MKKAYHETVLKTHFLEIVQLERGRLALPEFSKRIHLFFEFEKLVFL